jgi:hypothetical protein
MKDHCRECIPGIVKQYPHLLADKKQRKILPLYYLFGYGDIQNMREYLKVEKDAATLHKSAHKLAVKLSQNLSSNQHVLHHPPFL